MLKYTPSQIAASAIYLALKIVPSEKTSMENLKVYSGYTESHMKSCAKDLCALLEGVERCSLQAIKKKFSSPNYLEVALIRVFNDQQ